MRRAAANHRIPPWQRAWIAGSWSARITQHEEYVFLLLTIVIGALVGLVVVAFILLTENINTRLFPVHGADWRRVLIPVLGSLGMGFLLARYFPNARGSGVPQTKTALFANNGRISLRTVLGKFFCTSATLASGIPLGREGPSVQVGAGIASLLGRHLGLNDAKVKSLIPVGAAAAIAAAFNTPLAAVVFALEEVIGDLNAPVLGSVVLSSATSWMVLRLLLGNNPLFHVPAYQLVHPGEFAIYAVLGVAGGFVSVAFVKLLLVFRAWFQHQPPKTVWLQPVAGGIVIGLMGLFAPQTLGVGYRYVGEALNGNMALKLMALLVVLKLISVTVCYASGNAGGIFGPSLFIGAMLGGTVGSIAHYYFPGSTAAPGAYALVGMGAVFAGIVRVPMTSVLMIFEITQDYSIIVPLMIANLTSLFISIRFQPHPIYEALSLQDGVHLPSTETRDRHGQLRVGQAMRAAAEPLPHDISASAALAKMREYGCRSWPVADSKGPLGMVCISTIQKFNAEARDASTAGELVEKSNLHVHADQPLEWALERMGAGGVDALPVVARSNLRKLVGIVVLTDVLSVYRVDAWLKPPDESSS